MIVAEPLLSIVVPVYNAEVYLPRCISSILNQSFTDFELILVNNGSSDGSLRLIEDFARLDDRIIILDIAAKGVSLARNAGIKKASGKYIGFVDADDWIDRHMYEYLINSIEEYSTNLSCCKLIMVEDGVPKEVSNTTLPRLMPIEEFITHTYDRPGTIFASACNKIFVRKQIQELFDESLKCDEDAKFLIHYCFHIKNVSYTDNTSYYYNRESGSTTVSNSKIYASGLNTRRQLCEELMEFSESAYKVAEKHFLDRCCLSLSISKKEKQSYEYIVAKRELINYMKKNFRSIRRNSIISLKQKCAIMYWMIRCLI